MTKLLLAAVSAMVGCLAMAGGSVATPVAGTVAPSHTARTGGLPQLTPAKPGTLQSCESLLTFEWPSTVITKAEIVPAGALTNAGAPVGEHCLVEGRMNQRVSTVDGQIYAIGFQVRLPSEWAGRLLHQGNGGLDGFVAPATGNVTAGQLRNGLQMGFAVLSSDAGHGPHQTPLFGLDPQARLDYGYQAVGTLTAMAKGLVAAGYGRGPDRSYFAGGSNGGRHTMVAAARAANEYDGFLTVAPGFNLPKAAVAQLWGAQQYAKMATSTDDLSTALTPQERRLIADAILRRCDRLDHLTDGMVQAVASCQKVFRLDAHVPTCASGRNGTCLTRGQKAVVQGIFGGARNSRGAPLYSSFSFDPGLVQPDWAAWEFELSVRLDPAAVGLVFSTPPESPAILADTRRYALNYNVDTEAPKIYATNGTYRESAMSFMTPPNPARLDTLRNRGAKMIVVHGVSDAVFSSNDTARWYRRLDKTYHGKAEAFARYFEVPGMGHVARGPATDQFDGLGALISWVEYGDAPDRLVASARGEGNPGGVNADLPEGWAADRTRPLCPYPQVATYRAGDPERASSFVCKASRWIR